MTRCASEDRYPTRGLAWSAPDPLPLRIETPRAVLRSYEPTDAEALHRVVDACRASLLPWLPWAKEDHRDADRSLHFIMNNRMHLREPGTLGHVVLGVFDRETGELLGGHGVHDIRRDTASCETGYWLRPEARGRGLITEATAHVLSWCFRRQDRGGMGLGRVRIYCSSANTPSSRVPERLGLTPEVMQRRDFYVEGVGLTDRLGWGVLAEEWDCNAHASVSPPGASSSTSAAAR